MTVEHHWQAICIALAASTDNFLVGVSTGLSQTAVSSSKVSTKTISSQAYTTTKRNAVWQLVWGVALCNSAGSWLATWAGGSTLWFLNSQVQYSMAGAAFACLAYGEYIHDTDSSDHPSNNKDETAKAKHNTVWQLALPMTLNNLAGGVATGVAGVPAWTAAIYALIVSVLTMAIGVWFGKNIGTKRIQRHAATFSVVLYLALSLQSFCEAVSVEL